MKNPKHDYAVAAMNVRHHIGQPRDYEFAGPFHPALASHPRVLYEHFDLSNDLQDCIDCRVRIITADIFFD